jgi:ankyrin repeat protein
MTPLMLAIDNEAPDTALLVLELGANPHLWDWYGRTALYVAADKSTVGRGRGGETGAEPTGLDVVRRLLEAGVDPNPQLNMHRPSRGGNIGRFSDDLLTTGATPLLRAANSQDSPTVRLLLEHGAEVDLPNVMGVTPLIAAAGMGNPPRDAGPGFGVDETRAIETLQALLAAGADVDARIVSTYSRTATIARTSSMTEREGQTALYGAVRRGWVNVVEFLLEAGAMVDIVDARGRTPIDVAMGNVGGRDNTPSEEIATRLRQRVTNEE